MGKGNTIKYFPGANTCKGFISFYEDLLKDMNRTFIIKGGPGTGKSTFIRELSDYAVKRGANIELLCCSGDTGSYDGIILKKHHIAIVDGTPPHVLEPKNPGVVEEIINFGDLWDEVKLIRSKDKITTINKAIGDSYSKAYVWLKKAKEVHDDIEFIHMEYMDFLKADKLIQQLILELFKEKKGEKPKTRHMFCEAVTHEGIVYYHDIHTNAWEYIYVIKGAPGTGKSTLLKKVGKAAEDNGYDIDYYHCGFDPDSIDMIKVPQLKLVMLDGDYPHEVDLDKNSYTIINMLECGNVGKLVYHRDTIQELNNMESGYINEAAKELSNAKQLHDELEVYYSRCMYFSRLDSFKRKVINKIRYYASKP